MPVNISNIQAYALSKESAPVSISNVQAYATYSEPSPLALRNLQGYALVADIPFPKAVTGIVALANLVLARTKVTRPSSHFTVGVPEAYSGPETTLHNSRVLVTANPASSLQGSMYFYYSRASLIRIPTDLTAIVIGSATSVHGLIAAINAASGMTLTTDDLVNSPIPAGAVEVTITAAATSRFFLPGDTVQVGYTPLLSASFKTDTILWT